MSAASTGAGQGTVAGSRARAEGESTRGTVLSGVLFGAGIAAAIIDLTIFHLILQWHHFYDLSTTEVALVSDRFFHAAAWFITVLGLFMLADVHRRGAVPWGRWTGAVLVGIGAFQIFDGVVNHKVLQIYQVRYGVDLLPYNVVWFASAAVLLVIGLLILWCTRPSRTSS